MTESKSLKFLLSLMFGDERTISVCARVAYRDLQRNLTGIGKKKPKDKQAYKNEIVELIADGIDELLKNKISDQKAFDEQHKCVCDKICDVSKKRCPELTNGFAYGLAQKWLNMTIKNMLIMERWDKDLEKITEYLHVPVDSYIMEAASDIGVKLISKKGEFEPYRCGISKPWSQWNYNDYISFQNEVRKAVCLKGCSPTDWEFNSWLEVKNKRTN